MKEKKTQGSVIYQDIPKAFTEEEIKCSTKQAFFLRERERKIKELRLTRNGKINPDFWIWEASRKESQTCML